ncbi:hypothetical protein TVAG_190830 [Trichomonas vaginalis G3]|uniref:CS domain-containing protein n=1 Tax=Trichomonas vaginalis (strain ATCC PRA-98 / G3) TaxID=412133 RepID=A2EFG6_TRIV3|nr:tetratricopeptide repeat domain domain-containing protein [Trichomonas vaginalis G3]EAY08560.1 hypothetical protein TVAG_190830 [Trichomonas vaginalis G3]KAI5497845.1 tetratricopeptide repeat domain domain-containing protein [Trichomonas vaginalis G3]|eukprot:XP_001320783.1 hypothetical protein [Trichomonas vaginalis G3]
MITPSHQIIYDWEYQDQQEECFVTIHFPPTFNPQVLKYVLSEDKTNLILSMDSPIPIVCGRLWGEVKEIKDVYTSDKYVLSITKQTPEEWPNIIKAVHPEFESLDPKSAYIQFQELVLEAPKDPQFQHYAIERLVASAQTGFLPALRTYGSMMLTVNGQQQNGFTSLKTAADTYGDPASAYQVGLILASTPEGFTNGISYLKFAGSKGFHAAYLTLGQIYSPFTEFEAQKDPALAAQYLQQAIAAGDEMPQAYNELSKLYAAGVGVEKDLKKAQELLAKGEQLEEHQNRRRYSKEHGETAPPPEKHEDRSYAGIGKIIAIGGGIAAFVAGFSYAIYKKFSRK